MLLLCVRKGFIRFGIIANPYVFVLFLSKPAGQSSLSHYYRPEKMKTHGKREDDLDNCAGQKT